MTLKSPSSDFTLERCQHRTRTGRQCRSVVANANSSGNLSSVKSVGGGVYESRINFGPGYRIYFGRDGDTVVVLLGGGTKHRQRNDIAHALKRWTDYKQRKNQQKEEK